MVDETNEKEVRAEISRLQRVLVQIDKNNEAGRHKKYSDLYKDKWVQIYEFDHDSYTVNKDGGFTIAKIKDIIKAVPISSDIDMIEFEYYPESFIGFVDNKFMYVKEYDNESTAYSICIRTLDPLEVYSFGKTVSDELMKKFLKFNELNQNYSPILNLTN